MRLIIVTAFLILIAQHSTSQIHFEFLVPVGISSYTSSSIERIDEILGPNDFQYKPGFSTGLEARFTFRFSKLFALQTNLLYKRFQMRTVESLSRESYSWTFRETRIRIAEHLFGTGVHLRFTFLHFSNSELSIQLKTNIYYPLVNEAWTKQERKSYFNNETEIYNSYQNEINESLNNYLNAGVGISYTVGEEPIRWVFEAGYDFLYFQHEFRERSDITAIDWNNFYIGMGASIHLGDFKSSNQENRG